MVKPLPYWVCIKIGRPTPGVPTILGSGTGKSTKTHLARGKMSGVSLLQQIHPFLSHQSADYLERLTIEKTLHSLSE